MSDYPKRPVGGNEKWLELNRQEEEWKGMQRSNPHQLAEERVQLSSHYSTLSERLAHILSQKPRAWIQIRQGVNSDKAADREWDASEMGIEEMQIRLKLKASEKRQSAIRTMLEVYSTEARNQY